MDAEKYDIDKLLDDLSSDTTADDAEQAPSAGADDGNSSATVASEDSDQDGAVAFGGAAADAGQDPEPVIPKGPVDLKQSLIDAGVATPKQITAAETIIKQSPSANLADILLEQGVDEAGLYAIIAKSNGFELRQLKTDGGVFPFDEGVLNKLTPEFCKCEMVLPLGTENERLVLGTSRPDDVFMTEEVRLRLGARMIKLVVVTPSDIHSALEMLGADEQEDMDVDELLSDIDEDDVQVDERSTDEVDLEAQAAESPVIRYVNYIIQSAVKEGASDIHIEPGDKSLKVRFRIDGELFEMMQPPGRMAAAITSRLKIMGNLDIAERRLPQDGRIRCTVQGRKLDLRMSTLPTGYGEKTVMRILDTKSINVSLDDLGFDENTNVIWKKAISQPHGIVLVTGPTGSGKTTTLYASLRQMDKKSKNISTVEDPIEYHLEGVTQTQMHEKIGMTFARALKALLRQDPDIIMLGEIRDEETAVTAVQAALTGHLVLSTLHTNDAPSSITRLVNIGIEPFLLGAAVNACLAQRLVRRICKHCSKVADLTEEMIEYLSMQDVPTTNLFEGEGCDRCRNTGYQGRVGIYELLMVDDSLRDIIARNPNVSEFRRLCIERGMVTLRQDGFTKATSALTTIEEVIRSTSANF